MMGRQWLPGTVNSLFEVLISDTDLVDVHSSGLVEQTHGLEGPGPRWASRTRGRNPKADERLVPDVMFDDAPESLFIVV
jgi:hypothetical protein